MASLRTLGFAVALLLVPVGAASAPAASATSASAAAAEVTTTAPPPTSTTATTIPEPGPGAFGAVPRPNSGVKPTASGDRGGSAQLALLGIITVGLTVIGVVIARSTKRHTAARRID